MSIIGTLPNNIQNGQDIDASPLMADFNYIVNQVNANANPSGTLTAPSGTRMSFQQAAAPVGWVIDASISDHAMWANAGSGGVILSGLTNYSVFLGGTGATAGHVLSTAELASHSHVDTGHGHGTTDPGHVHDMNVVSGTAQTGATGGYAVFSGGHTNTSPSLTSLGINIGFANNANTGSNAAHSHGLTTLYNYAIFIVAQKS